VPEAVVLEPLAMSLQLYPFLGLGAGGHGHVELAALHRARGKQGKTRSDRSQVVLMGLGRGSRAAAGGRAVAPSHEGLQTLFFPQPSGNSSALRWKRSRSKWGRGQYENGYNRIKIAAGTSV